MALDLQTQVPVRGLVQRELGQRELVQNRSDIDTIHPLPRRGLENNRRAPLQADKNGHLLVELDARPVSGTVAEQRQERVAPSGQGDLAPLAGAAGSAIRAEDLDIEVMGVNVETAAAG